MRCLWLLLFVCLLEIKNHVIVLGLQAITDWTNQHHSIYDTHGDVIVLIDGEINPKILAWRGNILEFSMARLFVLDQTQGSTNRIVGT